MDSYLNRNLLYEYGRIEYPEYLFDYMMDHHIDINSLVSTITPYNHIFYLFGETDIILKVFIDNTDASIMVYDYSSNKLLGSRYIDLKNPPDKGLCDWIHEIFHEIRTN